MDDPSTVIVSSLCAIFLLWLGTSLLVNVVSSEEPWGRPSAWLIALALYGVAGLFIREVVRRWRAGERIGYRPSGPVLATIELLLGLMILSGAGFAVVMGESRPSDTIGLVGGTVLMASGTIGFLSLARRRTRGTTRA